MNLRLTNLVVCERPRSLAEVIAAEAVADDINFFSEAAKTAALSQMKFFRVKLADFQDSRVETYEGVETNESVETDEKFHKIGYPPRLSPEYLQTISGGIDYHNSNIKKVGGRILEHIF